MSMTYDVLLWGSDFNKSGTSDVYLLFRPKSKAHKIYKMVYDELVRKRNNENVIATELLILLLHGSKMQEDL